MTLIEKLRDIHAVGRIEDCGHPTSVCDEAANEIEKLRNFIDKWRYDGNLQTFESREIFRKKAKELLDA